MNFRFLHTCIALNILDGELDFILSRNVFPRGQEDLLLHVPVLGKEDMNGNNAGKVEDVNIVLDCNLDQILTNVISKDLH